MSCRVVGVGAAKVSDRTTRLALRHLRHAPTRLVRGEIVPEISRGRAVEHEHGTFVIRLSRSGASIGSGGMLSSMAAGATSQTRSERPVLIVDDDQKIVHLVRTYLEREGFRVVTAADGLAAIAAAREHQPQLVVLDLMLPGLDGFAVMRALRAGAATPILMLSARGNTADRIAGIATGADDYLPKPFSPAELVVRVHAILRRASPSASPDERRELADLVIDRGRHEVRRRDQQIELTHAEFWMLVALLDAGGRVVSREGLLDALYGRGEADVMDRTVDVYIRRLREKLGDDAEEPRYVATVRGAGYRAMIGP